MVRTVAKTVARMVPAINRLIAERDALSREVAAFSREVAALRALIERRPETPYDRRDLILQGLNLDGSGLEIGPSHNPLVPKSQGYQVETIDHADAGHLREKYGALGSSAVERIEEVDYVSDGRSMLETIGKPGRYDYIVASHVIEHVPDLVGFLKDCEQLLKPGGRLALAIPDKRYCFDVFQTLSTTGHALEARAMKSCRPSPGTVFDFTANFASGVHETWSVYDDTEPCLRNDLKKAKARFDEARDSTEYIDVHVWRFVPSSFRLIIGDLNRLGEISLSETSFVAPGGFEFFATLSRGESRYDRLSLARLILAELRCA
jgi:SAM-dependent methyltransferase